MSLITVILQTLAVADLKVYPRLITPGSPPYNEKVFFDFNDPLDSGFKLEILDLNGEKIREIETLNPQAIVSGWRLVWDGKDESGSLVMPGVYLYQWEEIGKIITGTIVVAR